jgi:DNA repair exonuclease SbcCD ATPase subunit
MSKIPQRLLQLKSALSDQDNKMVDAVISLLDDEDPSIQPIIQQVRTQDYDNAMQLIDRYLGQSQTGLVGYQDTELEALRLQLKALEELVEELSMQKSEQLHLISEFETKQGLATGDIVQQVLRLRKEIAQEKLRQTQERRAAAKQAFEQEQARLAALKKQREELEAKLEELDAVDPEFDEIEAELDGLNADIRSQQKQVKEKRAQIEAEDEPDDEQGSEESFEQAQQEYDSYEQSYQEAKEDKVAQLNDEDAGFLKKLFRKAVKLCHPDTVADTYKEQAHEIMQQLNNARDNGDIETVRELLERLEKGSAFVVASEQLTTREQIEAKLGELISRVDEISLEVEAINESEAWQLIVNLDSWEAYYEESRNELALYLAQLEKEYDALLHPAAVEEESGEQGHLQNAKPYEPIYSSTQKVKPKQAQQDNFWDDEF